MASPKIKSVQPKSEQPNSDRPQPWQKIDGWLILTSLLGCLAAAYGGWALEDLTSVKTLPNFAELEILRAHVLPAVFSVTACLFAVILLVYSTAYLPWRLLIAAMSVLLMGGCFVLAIGTMRYAESVAFYHGWFRFYYIKGLPAVPIAFFLTSWWLQNIFGPVKFLHPLSREQQKIVDFQFPVSRLQWISSLGMLVFVWSAFQFPTAVTSSDYFVPSIVGAALAVAIYLYLNVVSLICHLPAGRILAGISSLILFGAMAGGLFNSGALLFKNMLLADRYLNTIVATSIAACLSLAIWSTLFLILGRTPRRLKPLSSYRNAVATGGLDKRIEKPNPWLYQWSNSRRTFALLAGGLLLLLSAHFLPRYLDLPLSFCQDSTSFPNAKLVTEVRRLAPGLNFSEIPGRMQPRITVDPDLQLPATLRITSREFDNPNWQNQIQVWQRENRVPDMDCLDQIHTTKQLNLFGVSKETINGSEIDFSQIDLAPPVGAPGWEGVTLVDTHVTQEWIDFLTQFSVSLNFEGCTFDSNLKLPPNIYRISYSGKITDKQNLHALLRPQLFFEVSCSKIEDIQLTAEELKRILVRTEIEIFDKSSQFQETAGVAQEEIRAAATERLSKRFQQLNYSADDVQMLTELCHIHMGRWHLGKLRYGHEIPLPKNTNLPELQTDGAGNLIRLTMLHNNYYHTSNLDITTDLLNSSTLEVLDFHMGYSPLLFQKNAELPSLRSLRFSSKDNLDVASPGVKSTVEKLLSVVDQEQLTELELVYNLEKILEHCEPWPNMKSLAVVLPWPPSPAAVAQIKTAKNLELLILCNPDNQTSWNETNLAKRQKQWQRWLDQNQINVPTRLVSFAEQMSVNTAVETSDSDQREVIDGPEILLNVKK